MDTLWTPTDWNKEAELLKEYLGTKIYYNHVLIDASALLVEQTPEMILEAFKETGWMIVTDIDDSFKPSYKELTFEEWKESNSEYWIETEPAGMGMSKPKFPSQNQNLTFHFEQGLNDHLFKRVGDKTYYNIGKN